MFGGVTRDVVTALEENLLRHERRCERHRKQPPATHKTHSGPPPAAANPRRSRTPSRLCRSLSSVPPMDVSGYSHSDSISVAVPPAAELAIVATSPGSAS